MPQGHPPHGHPGTGIPAQASRTAPTSVAGVTQPETQNTFGDLLAANRDHASGFALAGVPGVARAGVCVLTCMDCRVDPLRIIGLEPPDAKVLRNPGGRVTDDMLVALVLSAHLLHVDRVLVIEHTRCAMASSTEEQIRARLRDATGQDTSWMPIGMTVDQRATLTADVRRVRTHPLIPDTIAVGGFVYDVDTGLLEQVC